MTLRYQNWANGQAANVLSLVAEVFDSSELVYLSYLGQMRISSYLIPGIEFPCNAWRKTIDKKQTMRGGRWRRWRRYIWLIIYDGYDMMICYDLWLSIYKYIYDYPWLSMMIYDARCSMMMMHDDVCFFLMFYDYLWWSIILYHGLWCDMPCHAMTWHDMIWPDMTWHDLIWYMISHGRAWQDTMYIFVHPHLARTGKGIAL